nr:unnamed protein product [Callosobruchus analis]
MVDNCKSSWSYDEFKTFLAPIQINDEDWLRECAAEATTGASRRLEASFILIVIEAANIQKDDELVAVATVFRHGDRSPLVSFPNDKYSRRYLRQRYKTFLSDQYKYQEIHVMSSDVDRTIMSAQLVLAGLYPPTKEDVWLEGFPWQPIPVHSIQTALDNFIEMKRECPKRSLLRDAAESEVLGLLRTTYPDIFNTILQNSGWSKIEEFDLGALVSTMNIYKKFEPSFVPEWYAGLDQQTLSYIADGAIKGEKHKFLMISGHDTTVSPLLDTIECYEYKVPEPGSAAVFEVYKSPSGKHYINLLYKNGAEAEAEPVKVDKCKSSWSYDEFKTFLAPVQINDEDWLRECAAEATTGASRRLEASFILIGTIFCC